MSELKLFDKWYMPDYEENLCEWMNKVNKKVDGRLAYQYTKYEHALKHVKNRGFSIDIGGHIGLWSYHMARDFKKLIAFEPMELHIECFRKNLETRNNWKLHEVALGAKCGEVSIETRTPNSSGDTGVIGIGDIPMMTLDSYDFKKVDFIKIDCEGYELNILKGGEWTIKNSKPVIIVEQKGNMIEKYGGERLGAVKFLEDLGYELKEEISGDYIMVA